MELHLNYGGDGVCSRRPSAGLEEEPFQIRLSPRYFELHVDIGFGLPVIRVPDKFDVAKLDEAIEAMGKSLERLRGPQALAEVRDILAAFDEAW